VSLTRCAWPGRAEFVTDLMPFINFLVHSYTCCGDRHASPYLTFIRRLISKGFTHSIHCSSLVHVASEAAIFSLLLRRRVAVLHRTSTCRQLVTPRVSLCQLTGQSSCVSNFYRNFKVFIWLSLAFASISK
jgi:hypothetical protein